jgi:hypothetical protein
MPSTYFPAGVKPLHPRSLIGCDFQNPILKTRAYPPSPLARWAVGRFL